MLKTIKSFLKEIIRGEMSTEKLMKKGLKVGKNFYRGAHVAFDIGHIWLISIGDNVSIASDVTILAHDASTKMHLGYTKIGRVNIGNYVFIGEKSLILPNVTIGDNAIIGAGSIVTKDVPPNSIVTGNPASVVGKTDEYIVRNRTKMEGRPVYDATWTTREGITEEMKEKMIEQLKDGVGYII